MPNFPSIYIELQEIWKRLNGLNVGVSEIDNKTNVIQENLNNIPLPYTSGDVQQVLIDSENTAPDPIPVTSGFIIVTYNKTTSETLPSLQTENIEIGQTLLVMSSLESDPTGSFSWIQPTQASYSNVYQGRADNNETRQKIFKPGSIMSLVYYGEGIWRMVSYNDYVPITDY